MGKLPTSTGAGVTEFWTINSITGERNKFTYQLLGCWASHQQYGHLVSLVVWGSIPMPSNMPRNLTCLLKRDYFNRKYIFQPLILIGHVSFPGGITRKKIVIVEPLSLFLTTLYVEAPLQKPMIGLRFGDESAGFLVSRFPWSPCRHFSPLEESRP